jgi:AcrR family transcriptional regulator
VVTTKNPRRSAVERREEIVQIALGHFGAGGYRGTSTEAIAAEAGISQPYLFRLFRTKRELFLACCDACHEAVKGSFERAAAGAPDGEKFTAMGKAYVELLADRRLLLFQMQSYAAASDAVIQAHVRDGYDRLVQVVTDLTGGEPEAVWGFFAHGMLLNVFASLDMPYADSMPGQED